MAAHVVIIEFARCTTLRDTCIWNSIQIGFTLQKPLAFACPPSVSTMKFKQKSYFDPGLRSKTTRSRLEMSRLAKMVCFSTVLWVWVSTTERPSNQPTLLRLSRLKVTLAESFLQLTPSWTSSCLQVLGSLCGHALQSTLSAMRLSGWHCSFQQESLSPPEPSSSDSTPTQCLIRKT